MPAVSPILLKKCIAGVTRVLVAEEKRAGDRNLFLSAYQILQLMSDNTRTLLLRTFGPGGKGSGNDPGAPEVVMKAAREIHDIEIMYMDVRFTEFYVEGDPKAQPQIHSIVPAGNEYFAIYRLPNGKKKSRRCKLAIGLASSLLKPKRKRLPPAGP
jgi:hypothetical protein